MQRPRIKPRLRRRRHSRQTQHQQHIPTHPMILINPLRILQPAIQTRRIILRNPHNRLHTKQNIRQQSQNCMRALEMRSRMRDLVVFYNYESRQQSEDGETVGHCVDTGSRMFLLGGVCGLQDQDRLRCEQ